MNRQKPLMILALLFYIVAPNFFDWIGSTTGAWYRPFIVWLLIIIVAFFIQYRDKTDDL